MSIGVGLVGYGVQFGMGKHHAEQVRQTQGLELRGVYDIDPSRRETARVEQPGARVYDTYEGMLEDPGIDTVVLITPHDTHAPLSVQASRAGKHVITEKVMCLNTKEADEMISAAREADRALTVYQNRRWDGDYLTVLNVMESGALGRVFQIESSVNGWWFPAGWRGLKAQGGGMLYDWGAHLTDQLVQLMLPAKPVSVYATFHHGGHDVDVETQATVVIRFENGVAAQIDVGCVSHISRPRWLVRGERAALLMEGSDSAKIKGDLEDTSGEMTVAVEKSDWHAFYKNISRHLNEGAVLAVKPEEVRIAIGVIEAAFESGRTGQVVDF
ncbi:MAG: Gfo/Idh/MocA family oxidoreductase [Armatimonadetes bacterium]|nr:Gfo/Idh/MocA family oxidoreductase [Armatimonadota bacterium]